MTLRHVLMLGLLSGCGFEGSGANSDARNDAGIDAAVDAPVDSPAARCATYETVTGAPASSRYRRLPTARTTAQLSAECATTVGAHLVVLDDAAEAAAIEAYAPKRNGFFWVGLTDAAVEGTWITARMQAATYLPWAMSQPDGGALANCALQAGGKLYDFACSSSYPSVCECE